MTKDKIQLYIIFKSKHLMTNQFSEMLLKGWIFITNASKYSHNLYEIN